LERFPTGLTQNRPEGYQRSWKSDIIAVAGGYVGGIEQWMLSMRMCLGYEHNSAERQFVSLL
jgi:hypothetical protein